nr:fibrinogen-like protein 1 [Drosophila bipectinata]
MDGSVDFNRNWTEYRDGFGNVTGEFFIGLEKLYHITQSSQYELLISLGKVDGSRDFVKYDNFKIGSEKNSYPLESAPCSGSGWTVIQRRMDGSVDFNRNWTEYRDGFGNLTGEFFIGLEKLHQITQSGQYELLIRLGRGNGYRDFIKYDNFKIGSEKNSYRLESVGNPTAGGAADYLKYNLNNKFSTYDRDNDNAIGSCVTEHGGGWWFAP